MLQKVWAILKTEPNSVNRIQTIDTLVISVVTYSFSIINWNLSDIKKMDMKTRKLLTCNKIHHLKAHVKRLYVPIRAGVRGLMELEISFKTTTIGLHKYICQQPKTGLYVLVMSRTRNSLLEAGAKSEGEVTATELEPRTT